MTRKTALITDSTSDLPQEVVEQYNIDVIPLYINWGSEEYIDGETITATEFYKRLPTDPNHPKTSQPTPGDFSKALERARSAGAEEIVIITISTALSGTHNSATQAASQVDYPVHIHDSKTTSMGLGWQVIAAAEARENGADGAAMVKAADEVRKKMRVLLYVDTLDYLHKGGRIGGAAKLLGTALNLKPQLYVDHEKGTVEAGARTRTKKRAHAALFDNFVEGWDTSCTLRVGITNANSIADANAFADRLREHFANVELYNSITSPVIGVHTGPEALAVSGYIVD